VTPSSDTEPTTPTSTVNSVQNESGPTWTVDTLTSAEYTAESLKILQGSLDTLYASVTNNISLYQKSKPNFVQKKLVEKLKSNILMVYPRLKSVLKDYNSTYEKHKYLLSISNREDAYVEVQDVFGIALTMVIFQAHKDGTLDGLLSDYGALFLFTETDTEESLGYLKVIDEEYESGYYNNLDKFKFLKTSHNVSFLTPEYTRDTELLDYSGDIAWTLINMIHRQKEYKIKKRFLDPLHNMFLGILMADPGIIKVFDTYLGLLGFEYRSK